MLSLKTNQFKPKTCAHCGNTFIPMRSMQNVCGPRCALAKVRADKAQAAKALRERKAKLKRIPELKSEAQSAFNTFVRERDWNLPCISCGCPPPDFSALHAGRDAGHYRSRGAADHLRYDERNCHAQCVHCNQHLAGNIVQYRIGLIARIGLEEVTRLESDNSVRKWTREELIGIRDKYRRLARELKAKREE